MGTGKGSYFLRRGVGQENLPLHFTRSPEDDLAAYGIPDGESNRPDFKDARVGNLDIGENLAAEHAVAEHGLSVDVQGNEFRFDGNRDQVDDVVYFPDIFIVVMEVIDIVHLVIVCGLGCIEEQVVQDQRVGRIDIQGVVLNRVTAQVGPLFGLNSMIAIRQSKIRFSMDIILS